MGFVTYPYHVKYNGVDYKPGQEIEVPDVAGHKLRGAAEVEAESVEKQAKPRRKAEKPVGK